MIQTEMTLAELAVKHAAASRVFYRYGLDFCCHGNRPLQEACTTAGLVPGKIVNEIEAESRDMEPQRWDIRPLPELVSFIVNFFHARLREELPQLVEMAKKVETVHED